MEAEAIRGWLQAYINEYCIYRVKPGDPLLNGNIAPTKYTWQFYLRRGLTNPEFLRGVAKLFWQKFTPLYEKRKFQIGGIETGATSLAAVLAVTGPPGLNCFMIRQDPKKYGLLNRFEGMIDYSLPVLLIDDLCGSKKSMLKASWHCAYNGLSLYDCAFAVVNKYTGRGPHPSMAKAIGPHFRVRTLFDLNDFDLDYDVYERWHKHPPPEWRLDTVTYSAGIGRKQAMLDYVYGHDALVSKFVADLIPTVRERGFAKCTTMGVIDATGKLIGGVIYHNWEPDARIIEMSVAAIPGSNWLSRETVRRMYSYPFHELDCQMVVNRMDIDNERLLSQCARLGYDFIKFPRMLGPDHDGVIGQLTREAWEANKFNQRWHHHVPAVVKEAA